MWVGLKLKKKKKKEEAKDVNWKLYSMLKGGFI